MNERYIVAVVADGLLAIWDQLKEDFHDGPFECEEEAKRLAFILNCKCELAQTH